MFRLPLTRRAQHRLATATLRDNATMIFPALAVSLGSGLDSPRRDRRLQTVVYYRIDKDFAAGTIRAQARTRCIRDASETWEHERSTDILSVVLAGILPAGLFSSSTRRDARLPDRQDACTTARLARRDTFQHG